MIITVIAALCQSLSTGPQPAANQPVTVCHEEVLAREDMPMQACFISQAAVADWKEHSRFRSADWSVARIRCVPGIAEPRSMI
jgi:uncharacterized protein